MPYYAEPPREHPSTYFIEDRGNQEEMARLEIQDTMLTTGMGGVLAEQPDPAPFQRVLDVGCGTGGWLLEMARTHPQVQKLVGVDVSFKMVEYARVQAEACHLDQRVTFRMMDVLRRLDFPGATFDLVNQRLGSSWLRVWEWTPLLLECLRVCRSGGVIRVTEPNILIESNSPALTKLNTIVLEAASHSGRLFAKRSDGIAGELASLLRKHTIENVDARVHRLEYCTGTESGQSFCDDVARFYRVALPFLQKWTPVPSNYQEIYQQALKEIQQPDFVATMTLVTAWGTKSLYGEPLKRRGLL